MIIAIAILSILLIICIFAIVNLLRKLETTSDILDENNTLTVDILSNLKKLYKQIKIIDSKGIFESDDEIGFVFKAIKENILLLENKYDIEEDTDE
tara:strand:- start:276 stop:563 length:288 start_codon:yes stop_codon:yes gene_type:complete